MRYGDSHKEETHLKILKIAGRALRAKGPDGVGVAEIMKEAGLTHGGFYAHFKSKDALLIESLGTIFARAGRNIDKMTDGLPPGHALASYIDFYVSPRHRDNPSTGCPITALNSDLPRQSQKFRATFDEGVKYLVARIVGWLVTSGHSDPEALAASVLSAMAGAVAVSRAVSDKGLSDEMLAAARAGIKARLGVSDVDLSRSMN
jgi:TetR/AcrR family transcriptional repressor of nem operon